MQLGARRRITGCGLALLTLAALGTACGRSATATNSATFTLSSSTQGGQLAHPIDGGIGAQVRVSMELATVPVSVQVMGVRQHLVNGAFVDDGAYGVATSAPLAGGRSDLRMFPTVLFTRSGVWRVKAFPVSCTFLHDPRPCSISIAASPVEYGPFVVG